MKDYVISGRIPKTKHDLLKKLNKNNSEIINEAIDLLIAKNSLKNPCIHEVYKQTKDNEYQSTHYDFESKLNEVYQFLENLEATK